MEKVIIFGNSLYAEHVFLYLTHDSPFNVVAFTVDRNYIRKEELFGLPVVPFETVESLFPPSEYKMIVSLGFQRVNRLREEKYFQAKEKGYDLITYMSSRAVSWPGLIVGDNCIISEAIINPYVKIGNDVTIGSGAVIGHHSVIKDHSFIAPGVTFPGDVTVEEYCLIGANATIKEGVTVARDCLIGAGVTITKNTKEKEVYVNRPPELYPKSSDELRTWLMWSMDPHKPRWSGRPKERENK